MSLVLIPVSVAMGLVGLGAFLWALRHGQFEDPEGNAWRAVLPQDPPARKDGPHAGPAAEPEDEQADRAR